MAVVVLSGQNEVDERVPFKIYLDEFQNFVVSSFEKILSEAGKAWLLLVLANQFLEQLNEGLQTAILSNIGALVSFRVSAESGRALQGEFGGFFGGRELTDLEHGQAVARLGKASDSFLPHTFAPPAEIGDRESRHEALQARVIARTRAELYRPRAEVESELRGADQELEHLTRAFEERAAHERAREKKSPKDETLDREKKAPVRTEGKHDDGAEMIGAAAEVGGAEVAKEAGTTDARTATEETRDCGSKGGTN